MLGRSNVADIDEGRRVGGETGQGGGGRVEQGNRRYQQGMGAVSECYGYNETKVTGSSGSVATGATRRIQKLSLLRKWDGLR